MSDDSVTSEATGAHTGRPGHSRPGRRSAHTLAGTREA